MRDAEPLTDAPEPTRGGRAAVAGALPRRAARGLPDARPGPGRPLRGQGGGRAGLRLRPAAPAAAAARGAGAARRARLPRRRGRRRCSERRRRRSTARCSGRGRRSRRRRSDRAGARAARLARPSASSLGRFADAFEARRRRRAGRPADRGRAGSRCRPSRSNTRAAPRSPSSSGPDGPSGARRAPARPARANGQPALVYYLADPCAPVADSASWFSRCSATGRASPGSATTAYCVTSGCLGPCRASRMTGEPAPLSASGEGGEAAFPGSPGRPGPQAGWGSASDPSGRVFGLSGSPRSPAHT